MEKERAVALGMTHQRRRSRITAHSNNFTSGSTSHAHAELVTQHGRPTSAVQTVRRVAATILQHRRTHNDCPSPPQHTVSRSPIQY